MTNFFKFHKNLLVDFSLIIAAAFSIFFGKINIFILLFSIVVHELGHITAASMIGAHAENLSIHGFGIELIFPGKTLHPAKMIVLASGGPVASFLLAFFASLLDHQTLFITNLSVGLFNLLPATPLDGGNILWGIFSPHLPRTTLKKISRLIGKTLGITVTLCGIPVLLISGFNFSLIYLGLFIFFSSDKTQNPVTEITTAEHKKIEKSALYVINGETTILEAASYLPSNAVGAVQNESGEITALITPLQLYRHTTDCDMPATVSLRKLIKKSTP